MSHALGILNITKTAVSVGDYMNIYPQYLGDVKHQDIYQPHPAKLSAQETLFGSVKIGTSVTCTLRHPASRCGVDDPQGFSWGNRFGVSWGFLLWQTTLYTLWFFNSLPWKMTHRNRWFTYYKW
jgi:hypothetical protein